ncbi:DUF6879 family protein [Nocardia takedensis]|uniref:DUF6879 family protein n=1 Tax=Nocardia takedensis TaxID=259390 RepID=UPI00059510F8|nr:DUF6879 family protein [Nocardia takedensis]
MLLVENDPWPDWFRGLRRSAFHLEVRDSYSEPAENERLRAFLAGEEPPEEEPVPWHALMRETTQRGVSVSRVRVVTEPLSDYHRWLLTITARNIASGEDIRYVPRHLAGTVPADDFWLFDDEWVVYNVVDEIGRPRGAAVTIDPSVAEYARASRDRLWTSAVPFSSYAAG